MPCENTHAIHFLNTHHHFAADTTNQPVLIANGEIEIEYVNEAWEKQFGYALPEVRGENPRMLKSGKTPDEVYKRMWQSLNAEKMFQTDEIIDKRKNGTHFNLLTTIFPVRHEGDIFFIQILDDITERKRMEALQKKFTETKRK
jgi:PAS domain S-box-containing protein